MVQRKIQLIFNLKKLKIDKDENPSIQKIKK